MKVTDEDSFLSRSMMTKAKNIFMKERIWITVKLTSQNRAAKVDVEPNATSWTHSRSSRLHVGDVTDVKRIGEWLNTESRNLVPGRTLTLRFVMLLVRSLSRSTELCSARQTVVVPCCPHADRDVHVIAQFLSFTPCVFAIATVCTVLSCVTENRARLRDSILG